MFFASVCLGQIPADSIPGTYAGLYYYKSPPSAPWIITQDTIYVSNMDTVFCTADYINCPNNSGDFFYTTYYSCNSVPSSNYYTLFFNGDSIKMIYDNVAQPPPNNSYSYHFYGKRISNKTASANGSLNSVQVIMYPNPANDVLNIDGKNLNEIKITDLTGREIKNIKTESERTQVDVCDLKNGFYFIQMQTSNGFLVRKIIIRH